MGHCFIIPHHLFRAAFSASSIILSSARLDHFAKGRMKKNSEQANKGGKTFKVDIFSHVFQKIIETWILADAKGPGYDFSPNAVKEQRKTSGA